MVVWREKTYPLRCSKKNIKKTLDIHETTWGRSQKQTYFWGGKFPWQWEMTNRRIIYTTGGLFHCYLGLPGYPRVSMFWKTGGIMASWMDNRIWYGYGSTSLFLVSCYWLTVTDPDPSQTHPPCICCILFLIPIPKQPTLAWTDEIFLSKMSTRGFCPERWLCNKGHLGWF